MTNHFALISRSLAVLALCAVASTVHADTGKDIFDKKCFSCHTIGGGDRGGPDLKGITAKRTTDWLVRVIIEPDKLVGEKDSGQVELLQKYGYTMPKLGISRDDALKVVAYLKEGHPPAGVGAGGKPAEEEPRQEQIVITDELIQQGKALFTGEKHFSKRGAPCVACHALRYPGVRGGNFGADLTDMYSNMGEQGLWDVLKTTPFPAMKKMYEERPMTDDEVKALVAFAKDAAMHKEVKTAHLFPWAGIVFFGVIMGIFTLYRRRIR